LKSYLRELSAVHDMGSFRNVYARTEGAEGILKGHQQVRDSAEAGYLILSN